MNLYGMTYQLRQYRQLELTRQRDYTPQALALLNRRIYEIDNSALPEERKAKERQRAEQVWSFTMQREIPAEDVEA